MNTNKRIQTRFVEWLLRIGVVAVLAVGNISPASVGAAAPPPYIGAGSVNVAPASPTLTAVDPLTYFESTDVIPARPFLYSVDANGLTITRFNDNAVVGTWPWPE